MISTRSSGCKYLKQTARCDARCCSRVPEYKILVHRCSEHKDDDIEVEGKTGKHGEERPLPERGHPVSVDEKYLGKGRIPFNFRVS